MQTIQGESTFESTSEHPIDEYVRLCREATMIKARLASLLTEIKNRRPGTALPSRTRDDRL
jgi:hypothetical protein